jgi:hypothetical protein
MAEPSTATASKKTRPIKMSPELIRAVAEKVYALWLRDLAVEQERQGHLARRNYYE